MKFTTGYEDADTRREWSDANGFATVGDSLTVQADARDADINVIMDRYARTGQIPGLSRIPTYDDFSGIADFREALHAVREAEDLFMQMPAKVRARFENDPGQFVEFCSRQENRLELADLGLLSKEVADAVRAEVEASQAVELPQDKKRANAPGQRSSTAAKSGSPKSDDEKDH